MLVYTLSSDSIHINHKINTVLYLKVPMHLKTQGILHISCCDDTTGEFFSLTSDLCACEWDIVSSGLVLWELLIVSGMDVTDISRYSDDRFSMTVSCSTWNTRSSTVSDNLEIVLLENRGSLMFGLVNKNLFIITVKPPSNRHQRGERWVSVLLTCIFLWDQENCL